MAIDWRDQTRKDVITFQMVTPTNVDKVYGELEGVDLSGSSLTASYYTDTRTSGKVRVVGGNWVRGSMIRVIHSIPEWNYKKELGTDDEAKLKAALEKDPAWNELHRRCEDANTAIAENRRETMAAVRERISKKEEGKRKK